MKFVLVSALLLAVAWPEAEAESGDCSFPDYLQQRPRWEGQITYARRKTRLYWKFYEEVVEMIDYSTPTPQRYEQRCEEQLPGGKFLLRETDGKREEYVCMQFLQRSDHVIQIKVSDRSPDRSVELCEDANLRLDDWPLVWPKADEKFQSCPLVGGFDFSITDHQSGATICDNAFLMPHIESECMAGEGIKLDFRHFECRGDLDMELVSELVCLGSWEAGGYTFSVVTDRDEFWPKLWMLRFPTAQGDAFDLKLMSDIVADQRPTVRAKKYYTLHMKRPIYPSLCSDEASWCEGDCGSADTYFCQKTCAKCDETQSVPKCAFPDEARGEWQEMSQHATRGITVTTSMMYAEDNLPLQCYDLNTQAWFEGEGRRAVATLFKNGCRPRYTCVQFRRLSENVLHYRLSQNLVWPHSVGVTAQQVCATDNFRDDLPPLKGKIRSEHPKALIRKVGRSGRREMVDCGVRKHLLLRLMEKDGGATAGGGCGAEVNTCYSNTSFTLRMGADCSHTGETALSSYGCLAAWADGTDRFIISENKADPADITCWVFHRDEWNLRPTTKVYMMRPADCHAEAASNILYRNSTDYLAEFDVAEGGEECPGPHDTTRAPLVKTTPPRVLEKSSIAPTGFIHQTERVPGLEKTTRPSMLRPGENDVEMELPQSQRDTSGQGRAAAAWSCTLLAFGAVLIVLY